MRSKTPVYSLSRQLLRASWNKYNLFNLSRKPMPSIHNKTMYQQKWNAKKETRAYHGDHINEKRFKKSWDKKLVGVLSDNPRNAKKTPLASQTYASLERRLDTVLFRSMFAASTRQARQMIVHGKVKVNGIQTRSPSQELKAGDLYEVMPAAAIANTAAQQHNESSKEAESEESEEQIDAAESNGSTVSKRSSSISKWEAMGQHDFVPRPYMSGFAFIPAFLEVDHETCCGVYLRDPVARPGQTEVPSPFPAPIHALASNFYQRGR